MKERDILIYLHSLFLHEPFFDNILNLDNLEDVLFMSKEDLMKIDHSTELNVEKILSSRSKDYINKLVDAININCTEVKTILDDDFPVDLKLIEKSPKVLYIKGLPLDLSNVKIGVVGARKATAYGKFAVEKFVSQLAKMNTTIISGMAQGIDAKAHKEALDNGTYSIGVVASGVDYIYPPKNKELYERMYEQGTILSEYPLGTRPQNYYFPERNRIISGLSDGVIVIEAKEKSGSLITARLAAEQGKEVFAVPGNINSVYSVGTNKLIRDGAIPLIEIEDLIYSIAGLEEFIIEEKDEIKLALSDDELLVLENIKDGIDTIDKIVEETNLDISRVSAAITLLEMKGIIKDLNILGFKLS